MIINGLDKIPNWEKSLVIEAGPSDVIEKTNKITIPKEIRLESSNIVTRAEKRIKPVLEIFPVAETLQPLKEISAKKPDIRMIGAAPFTFLVKKKQWRYSPLIFTKSTKK